MIDIRRLRENPEQVIRALKRRDGAANLQDIIGWDRERRKSITDVEELKHARNRTSEKVGALKKEKKDAKELIQEMKKIKEKIKEVDERIRETEEKINKALLMVPNIPDDSVPDGRTEEENSIVREGGIKKDFDFPPRKHWEIGKDLDMIDFDAGAKISGSSFALLKGEGALLERALISFMLSRHIERGYREIFPPFMVTGETMTGTGQLPKFSEELYKSDKDDLYLIPTAEVPLTNIYRDEIIKEGDLPVRYVAYSACFRREAGSYGKDTKGLIRNHQFNKVELVKFTSPYGSFDELESLLGDAEDILIQLGIPYRVSLLCAGDLGFGAAKTYDLEVWMPGENRWREVSSCSNFTDFQARRMNIRYRHEGSLEHVHTLNGSGLAVGRTMAALIENFQEKNGTSVRIPMALKPFMNGKESIG